jgi:hypothetical protein
MEAIIKSQEPPVINR